MQLHFAELDALGLDFYHLSENVHRARRKLFGEESPEGKAWADELMHVFKHEGYAAAWERLLAWRTRLRVKTKRHAADRLLHFVSARRKMIRYPEFREHGWQIGSGPTESQCKLCTKRLKGYGRRWDRPNATAVAALDTLDRNRPMRPLRHDLRPPRTLVTPPLTARLSGRTKDSSPLEKGTGSEPPSENAAKSDGREAPVPLFNGLIAGPK
jgi:hypothetical protein